MKKLITSIFILLFLMPIIYAQKNKIEKLNSIDSISRGYMDKGNLEEGIPYFKELSKLAKELKDYDLEARGYNFIAEFYMNQMDSVNSVFYVKKCLSIAEKQNKLNIYLLASNQLGRVYYHFRDFQKSIEAYNAGIKKYYEKEDEKLLSIVAQIYSNSTWSYERLGQMDESINAVFKGIEIAEKIKSTTQICYGYYALGAKYRDLNNYKKSEKYFLKSLKLSDSVSQYTYVYMNHHGLGILYSRWGKFDNAMYHNKLALVHYRKTGNKIYEFDVLNNIAVVYQRLSKYDSVIFYGEKALKIARELNHKLAINGALSTLSTSYLENKNYKKAKEYLLEIAKETINPSIIDVGNKISLLENLSEVYSYQNDYKNSLKFYKNFKRLDDSIKVSKLESNFAELENKYQSEQKEKENLLLKSKNSEQELLTQKATNRNWLLGFSLLLLSVIALFIWIRFKAEVKAKKTISKQKEEIEQQKNIVIALQKELHHRMKNNLAFVDVFINLAKGKFKNEAYQTKLNELQTRLNSMFEIHKQLFNSEDITQLNANDYISKLINNLDRAYHKSHIVIKNNTNKNEKITANNAFPIGLIVNEFITNSYKYAFDEQENGEVAIELSSNDSNYELNLKDNGKGLPKDLNINQLNSFGLEIIQLLTQEYKGVFEIINNNGVQMKIALPKTSI